MLSVLLAGGVIDIITVFLLWDEACPVVRFEGRAACAAPRGADQLVVGLRCSLRVLLDGTLAPLHLTPPLRELQLFLLHLLLIFPAVAGPIRGAHELGALVLRVPVVFVLRPCHRPKWFPLVVDTFLDGDGLAPLALFSTLAGPPDADDDAEHPEHAQDHAQNGHQVVHWLGHDRHLHFDLNDGEHDSAVVPSGQRADYGAGSLLDLTVVRLIILLERDGSFYRVLVFVGEVAENQQGVIFR